MQQALVAIELEVTGLWGMAPPFWAFVLCRGEDGFRPGAAGEPGQPFGPSLHSAPGRWGERCAGSGAGFSGAQALGAQCNCRITMERSETRERHVRSEPHLNCGPRTTERQDKPITVGRS